MKGHTPEAIGATMTSQEIADLVGSRHDNVKRTIDTLAASGVITFPQTEEKPTGGRPVTIYVFTGERGKRDSIIVVAQLCPEFTARLVDRWQELEQRLQVAAAADLSDRVNASLLLVESMRMSRPSTKGPNKEFWSVTTKGLLFGKNMTSPGNPRETQPHFFESRADELLAMIAG